MDQLDIAGVLIGMELKKRVQKCDSSNLTVDLVRIIFILFDLSSQEQNHFFPIILSELSHNDQICIGTLSSAFH